METTVPAEEGRRAPYVAVVSASPVPASRTLALARHVGARLATDGADVRYVDVRDLPADDLLGARPSSAKTKSACALVEGAAGIVLVTPVYNAAYSGVLKAFLDILPQFGLRGKVALPLAVGGTVAHMLVIDYALRPVLASMGTPYIVGGVFLLDKWISGHDSGELIIDQQVAGRLQQSLHELGRVVHERASTGPTVGGAA
jgi:FMN reductase